MAGALSALCQAGKTPAVTENGSNVTYDLLPHRSQTRVRLPRSPLVCDTLVDTTVLALRPDAVDVERAQLVDEIGVVGATQDRRHLPRGHLVLDAIRSDVHGLFPHCRNRGIVTTRGHERGAVGGRCRADGGKIR